MANIGVVQNTEKIKKRECNNIMIGMDGNTSMPEPCKRCMSNKKSSDIEPLGYVMSLAEMEERQILACDIMQMLPYPVSGGNLVSILDCSFDSRQRIIFFIPGREAKYVKVPK